MTRRARQSPTTRRLGFEQLEQRLVLDNSLTLYAAEVKDLLSNAVAASARTDAIIAVVDRGGHILGVRTEQGVQFADVATRVFAIDGAVSLARTAAFFSNDQAPLTSRTVREISQSTITQREVESNPNIMDVNSTVRGPGFVAPIGVGGNFPPGVMNTGSADLFGIEHTNRDSVVQPGFDGMKDINDFNNRLTTGRFNAAPSLDSPESYGYVSAMMVTAQSRGIGTLPGGLPIYKKISDNSVVLVGGIGVFFPGPNGWASFMQGFQPGQKLTPSPSTEDLRTNQKLELLAEWMAYRAITTTTVRSDVDKVSIPNPNNKFTIPLNQFVSLAGITLDEVGPRGQQGLSIVSAVGATAGTSNPATNGADQIVYSRFIYPVAADLTYLDGQVVPSGPLILNVSDPKISNLFPSDYIVAPRAGTNISAAEVTNIIKQGIIQALQTRAQIRLQLKIDPTAPFPSTIPPTAMVFAVSDKVTGEVLGLYRMYDATVFSIDVAVAKARNTQYYADMNQIQPGDQVSGIAKGTDLTNRTFRTLALPSYPSGATGMAAGPFSNLNDFGIDPKTGENLGLPQPAWVYMNPVFTSVYGFDSFNVGRNFRSAGNIKNQNGVVFFPGSSPIYHGSVLVGGFGVSGDGVNQDDVVTYYGASLASLLPDSTVVTADKVFYRGARLPMFVFSRNGLTF